ncbi:hypothetical protein VNO78_33640 [Psophocarpus tetragonolobus]|uniref:Uncharacterized protein n=1 Tax=Psophocarpus tetragonolobus TaxID=3891 RepID=A0AAN9NXL2_PSOTE
MLSVFGISLQVLICPSSSVFRCTFWFRLLSGSAVSCFLLVGYLQNAAIEYEKKGFAENYEHSQVMKKKLVAMALEIEKLHAEIANAEKRARAAATAGNTSPGYNTNYGSADTGYAGNPYPGIYGMNPVSSVAS